LCRWCGAPRSKLHLNATWGLRLWV